MFDAIKTGLDAYVDFCAMDAEAAFREDEESIEKADVAWDRWRGMRTILSVLFGITERQVEDDVEQMMFDATFAKK